MRDLTQLNKLEEYLKNKGIDTPGKDIVYRQDVIDALFEMYCKSDEEGYVWIIWGDACKRIDALPSAQPEIAKRIVGKSRDGMTHWYQCDMCNEPVDVQDNFCRGCGRRLTDE